MLFSGIRIGNYVRNMLGLFAHRLGGLSIRKHCRAQSPSYAHRDKNHLRIMESDVRTTYTVMGVGRTLELVHGCSNRKKTCVCYDRSSPTTLFSHLASQIHANIDQQIETAATSLDPSSATSNAQACKLPSRGRGGCCILPLQRELKQNRSRGTKRSKI